MKVEHDYIDPDSTAELLDISGIDLDIDTGLFATKPYQFIGVIQTDGLNYDDIDEVSEFVSLYVGSGNDGHLFWIPAKAAPHFAEFAHKFLIDAYKHDELNINNGPISESFVLYHGTDGLVVAMIDPECGTTVFDDAISKFSEEHDLIPQYNSLQFDPTKAFNFEDCHLSSNLQIGRNDLAVDAFLRALHERGLIQELEYEE